MYSVGVDLRLNIEVIYLGGKKNQDQIWIEGPDVSVSTIQPIDWLRRHAQCTVAK